MRNAHYASYRVYVAIYASIGDNHLTNKVPLSNTNTTLIYHIRHPHKVSKMVYSIMSDIITA